MTDFNRSFVEHTDFWVALHSIHGSHQAHMWTALPGIIQTVDLTKMTATVQPAIKLIQVAPDNTRTDVALPVLPDVPIVFQRGGGYTLTFPVQPNDECLLVFSSRCIDNWWQQGGVQSQFEPRKHDLSDAFAIVGPFSQPEVIGNVSTSNVQLRSNDGGMFFELDLQNNRARMVVGETTIDVDNGGSTITATAAQSITLDTPVVNITGVIDVKNVNGSGGNVATFNGTAVASRDFISGTISGQDHTHPDAQGGVTGPPVGGGGGGGSGGAPNVFSNLTLTDLPTSQPSPGSGVVWNNGGVLCVA